MSDPRHELPESLLRDLEQTAVELARLAGAEIQTAMCRPFAVAYKGAEDGAGDKAWRNPVSEVDHATEVLVRTRLAERFPLHDIIGEELDERPGLGADFVWAIDPIDGTANFVNGFPLFAASIGLLYRGYPLVGAIWCSTSHALQTGVYHARHRGPLCFEAQPIAPRLDRNVRRHLAGDPGYGVTPRGLPWDTRHTGSAAIECAFTAAGLLRVTRLEGPHLWDCAAGVSLVLAAGGALRLRREGVWEPFECFEAPVPDQGALADLRYWRGALLLGDEEAVDDYAAAATPAAASKATAATTG